MAHQIHACHPSRWIHSEIFTQWFLHFIQHTKADKIKSCYLSTGRALFTHNKHGGHYFSSRESCWHHFPTTHNPPPSSQLPQNTTLLWNFHGAPENILLPINWKTAPLKPSAIRHRLPNRRTIRQCIQRAVTGEITTNGFRATGLFLCDKIIFRPHDFLLVSEDTDATPVNHPALVKPAISHYSILLIFRRLFLLRLSEHQTSAQCKACTYSQILVLGQQRK